MVYLLADPGSRFRTGIARYGYHMRIEVSEPAAQQPRTLEVQLPLQPLQALPRKKDFFSEHGVWCLAFPLDSPPSAAFRSV